MFKRKKEESISVILNECKHKYHKIIYDDIRKCHIKLCTSCGYLLDDYFNTQKCCEHNYEIIKERMIITSEDPKQCNATSNPNVIIKKELVEFIIKCKKCNKMKTI